MRLHKDKELFKDAVAITAQQMKLPEIYVEKDYWVTLALNRIFSSSVGNQVVFKGGTALSKCYEFIKRFSEDIDLVVLRQPDDSGNRLREKLKKITSSVSEELPEIEISGITNKRGMIRKTVHSYTNEFDGEFGQVRDVIIVEATWLGYFEPYTTKSVSSFIYEMMLKNGQEATAKVTGLLPFDVLVLEPKRTLCEKIMSLVRFSYTDEPVEDLKKKIRHAYDIHMLLQNDEINKFFFSNEFDILLRQVAQDDVKSFKNNNGWLAHHPIDALIFDDTENIWVKLKETYEGTFKNLVFGSLPHESRILNSLNEVCYRMETVYWEVNLKEK